MKNNMLCSCENYDVCNNCDYINNKDEVTFTFFLGGKLVCGQEDKPDSCLECNELASCVMDMFQEAVSKNEPNPLDVIDAYCRSRIKRSMNPIRKSTLISVSNIIDDIKANPSLVIERAKIEGWYPERNVRGIDHGT